MLVIEYSDYNSPISRFGWIVIWINIGWPVGLAELRGRPLMIWGRRKNRKWIYFFCGNAFWKLFFPGKGLLKFFFPGRPLKFFFFLEVAPKLFSVYKPIKRVPNFFSLTKICLNLLFPEESLLKFIFSWGRPSEIYFFLRKDLRIFFLDFLGPHPRSLMAIP